MWRWIRSWTRCGPIASYVALRLISVWRNQLRSPSACVQLKLGFLYLFVRPRSRHLLGRRIRSHQGQHCFHVIVADQVFFLHFPGGAVLERDSSGFPACVSRNSSLFPVLEGFDIASSSFNSLRKASLGVETFLRQKYSVVSAFSGGLWSGRVEGASSIFCIRVSS